jgi:pantoate--beta-alanine ligase
MFIFKRVPHLQAWLAEQKKIKKSIGFVPTMGALHDGHLSLVQKSKTQCALTLVSIFVNPLQFNDPEDLKKYPRPVEADIQALYHAETDALLLPDEKDIYPEHIARLDFDPGTMGEVMEGKFRPGHFKGVAEVVYRLLSIAQPDRLYLGQKDFQQVAIIRKLIADLQLPVEVIACPTIREENGLAMSSRNLRLSKKGRQEAGLLYATLQDGKLAFAAGESPEQISHAAIRLFKERGMKPDYFEIVDGRTLQPLQAGQDSNFVVACCAVYVEGIRLIDNLIYKEP